MNGPQAPKKNNIIIAVPSYDGRIEIGTSFCLTRASLKEENRCVIRTSDSSSNTGGFNTLFAEALNERKHGLTHFAMLHIDVVAEHGWLDKMLDLMEKHEADILSAVIPIKTRDGYVSTAIDQSNGAGMGTREHYAISALNLREVHRMKDATFTDENLLINTGLMLIDMRKPWVEQICFRFENEILKMPDGEFKAFQVSEDWHLSRQARALGAKLYATREVKVKHMGRAAYPNDAPWGTVGVEK